MVVHVDADRFGKNLRNARIDRLRARICIPRCRAEQQGSASAGCGAKKISTGRTEHVYACLAAIMPRFPTSHADDFFESHMRRNGFPRSRG
jgi:hypothetical protein